MAHGYPDFEGDKSRVYSVAEWAVIEGTDLSFSGSANNVAPGAPLTVNYNVTAGKTLYITQFTFSCYANLVADMDNNQFCAFAMYNFTTAEYLLYMGRNGGGGMPLNKPISVAAGNLVQFVLGVAVNHNCDLRLSVGGYEV